MNAPASIPAKPAWYRASGVYACRTCDGDGVVGSLRRATINDPYPEDDCPDCTGPHEPECPTCGYQVQVPGYDCFVCETLHALPEPAEVDADAFCNAFTRAVIAAKNEKRRAV